MSAQPTPAPEPACRYYGRSHVLLKLTGLLVQLGGLRLRSNECAVIFDSHAPCKMEMLGYAPDARRCPIARSYERSQGGSAPAQVV
jgi:hypothetical protein